MCFKKLTKMTRKMESYDISLVKLATAAIILLIAKYYPVLTSFEWHWYVIVAIIASTHPIMKMFGK
jgi:hypothetical protein